MYDQWGSDPSGAGGWKRPVAVISIFSLLALVLGSVSTGIGNSNGERIRVLQDHPNEVCAFGDVLFGEAVHEGSNVFAGGKKTYYQVVGTHGASITWNKALADAKTRCYKGYPGYLAMIGSYEENKFISDLVAAAPTFETTDYAWIGGTDTQTEGEYAWIGPQKLSDGIVFWKDDESFDGSYTNWAPDEPNEGGATGMGEDCVEMSFWAEDVYGKWNDMSCYKGQAFFVVEFGPPTLEDEWDKEHDDALDDDALRK